MEFVDGDAITTCCANRRLGVEDRIRLYVEVCRAVEAAHQHLIVHRDLKPSNILVSRDGRVKLVDFGIAKPLDRDAFRTATQTGGHPMTPEYAAPEHIRGGAITVMTDVYGLGVVLY
jgi:serine/threonine-protein kinase